MKDFFSKERIGISQFFLQKSLCLRAEPLDFKDGLCPRRAQQQHKQQQQQTCQSTEITNMSSRWQ